MPNLAAEPLLFASLADFGCDGWTQGGGRAVKVLWLVVDLWGGEQNKQERPPGFVPVLLPGAAPKRVRPQFFWVCFRWLLRLRIRIASTPFFLQISRVKPFGGKDSVHWPVSGGYLK